MSAGSIFGGLARGLERGWGLGSKIKQTQIEKKRKRQIMDILRSQGAPEEYIRLAESDPDQALTLWKQKEPQQRLEQYVGQYAPETLDYTKATGQLDPFYQAGIQKRIQEQMMTPEERLKQAQQQQYAESPIPITQMSPQAQKNVFGSMVYSPEVEKAKTKEILKRRRPLKETGGLTEGQAYNIAMSQLDPGADPMAIHLRTRELLAGKPPFASQQMTGKAEKVGWEYYPETETKKTKPPQDFIQYVNDRKKKGIPINWNLIEQEHPDWDLTGLK